MNYLLRQSIKNTPEQLSGQMKFFFWGCSKVTPSTWQTIILPAPFIMICQQLKQNIFWKQIKYNCWCSSILALDYYTDIARKICNFSRSHVVYPFFKSLVDIHTEWAVLSFNFSDLCKKLVIEGNFPQHHRNSDSSAEDDNSPPYVCHYFKHCCLVGKRAEPWFHSVPNHYLHWELFNNNSQCDSSLLWVVKHAIGLPSCLLLQLA